MAERDASRGRGRASLQSFFREKERLKYTVPQLKPDVATVHHVPTSNDQIVPVVTNYFPIENEGRNLIQQYDVTFTPNQDNQGKRHYFLKTALKGCLGKYSFDNSNVFSRVKLQDGTTCFSVVDERNENCIVEVKLKHTRTVPPGAPEVNRIYDVTLHNILKVLKFTELQGSHFKPNLRVDLPSHRLTIWPGFSTTIQHFDGGLMMHLDVKSRILRTDTVHDFMRTLPVNDMQRELMRALIGSTVVTSYNSKYYKVDDIDFTKNPTFQFEKKDGTILSIMDYLQNQYHISVKDLKQPLLVSRPKKKTSRDKDEKPLHLVPEFCNMTGISDQQKANFSVMKDVGQITRIPPSDRVRRMQEFVAEINRSGEARAILKEWGLEVRPQLLQVNAYRVKAEEVLAGPNETPQVVRFNNDQADWQRSLNSIPSFLVGRLAKVALIFPVRVQGAAQAFQQTMLQVGKAFKVDLSQMKPFTLQDDLAASYLTVLRALVSKSVDLAVCVLTSARKETYDAIKKETTVNTPVATQCILLKTMTKNAMSVATKVVMQMNVKAGGCCWTTRVPFKAAMIVGIDTYHDTANRGHSVAAFVCSLDKFHTRFFSCTRMQKSREELSENLPSVMLKAVEKYAEVNGSYPQTIVVYRDGVADSQLHTLKEVELNATLQQLKDAYVAKNLAEPQVAFIVVSKRISTRIMTVAGSNFDNPKPGTVLDNTVTRPEFYDFYLVHQSVRQGTVTPTRYNVIYDSIANMTPQRYQVLSHKLTHMYQNWSGTVRVPSVCQYAHKLAFLVGNSVHEDPSDELADRLYFL